MISFLYICLFVVCITANSLFILKESENGNREIKITSIYPRENDIYQSSNGCNTWELNWDPHFYFLIF